MRYPASEKVEIIRSWSSPTCRFGVRWSKSACHGPTFYRWYDRYQTGGPEALEDRLSRPSRVWNRIPDDNAGRGVEGVRRQTGWPPW